MATNTKQPFIIISPQAKADLLNILNYLKENWGQKFVDEFLQELESFSQVISINPRLFGYYNKG